MAMTTTEISLLPRTVKPLRYQITLTPDLENFTFKGEIGIDIEVIEETKEIVLNAIELEIQNATLSNGDGVSINADKIELDETSETATLNFLQKVVPGRARLNLSFTGELNDRLHGFYRSRYVTPMGEARYLGCTQFEATDARRAFPCWDEPSYKAIFDLTLVVPIDLTALANTPVIEEVEREGKRWVTFAETPRMSTYLLAFLVGEFESIEADANGTLIRIWTTPGKVEQGRFALEMAVGLLGYYNDYFGIPYPLPKLDHIALPDFAAGAMENWGAITYRETALLVDPANSAAGNKQRVAEVVAHEMAHMWFGDLVTMAWWDDLWLNESFASWMGTKAVDNLCRDWQMWTQFLVDDVGAGMAMDALKSSHPIHATVRDPAEVSQLFDAISYSKGASLLRMLEQFLGEDNFQHGLQAYLAAYQYQNARGADLWEALGKASGQPVPALMDSWIRQTGYPVLQVRISRDENETEVRIEQKRFLFGDGDNQPIVWPVPVVVSGKGAMGVDKVLMDGKESTLRLEKGRPASPSHGWVKVNTGQTGFYRVSYDAEEWDRLIPAIEALELPAVDRLGIQSDGYALCRARLLPATRFLQLANVYKNETEYSIWRDLASSLRGLDQLFSEESYQPKFHAFARALLKPVTQKVGWHRRPDEGHLDALLRSIVLGEMGVYGDDEVLEEAGRQFEVFLTDQSLVSPDLRGVVFQLASRAGGASTHEKLRTLARETTLQEERMRLHAAMCRAKDPVLLQRTLDMLLSDEVRPQDTVGLLGVMAGNSAGRHLTWEFIKDHWEELDRRYGSGGFGLMRLVETTGHFTNMEDYQDVAKFFQNHPIPAATMALERSLERIGVNIRWLQANREELTRWLDSFAP
jgi:puromycin-sensitive aminopeptidase